MNILTHTELLNQLNYDELTGLFTWKVLKRGVSIGSLAGSTMCNGYIQIVINEVPYLAHRLAWFYVYGYMPENLIDHEDRVRHHNWILNLREVSGQCSQRNRGMLSNNTSEVKGVSWNIRSKKWMACIGVNGKNKNLGYYKNFDNAVCARLAGEQCLNWTNCDSNSSAFQYVQLNIQKSLDLIYTDGGL